ncbi:LppM family (lipo)protein [Actinomyces ruminicola]|uniref:LppM domain-containing protein n=1 Tax=Actinomyces ruminicola TaxID=332524 RepID=A0A1G9RUC4_9ACTO|nr:hypothetical protein [Actinomyces ruminicola]SDM26831.1 hypothetical protein SAMN04487766_101152 [Actinomyces ruminicola]
MAADTRPLSHRSAPGRAFRARLLAVAAGTAALALSGCTAHMDMRLDASGSYDVDLVMRDTTGTVFTADTDCQEFAAESLVGTGEGVTVTASPVGSADAADGLGCEVHVTGVPIPDAAATDSGDASDLLVVRDGDLYVVRIAGYGSTAAGPEGAGQAATADSEGPGGEGAGDAPAEAAGGGSPATDAATEESLNTVVDARLSITFPGAVVDAGGGRVSGTTVTWDDADALYDGVTASGRATAGAGLSAWDRYGAWIAAGVAAAGLAVGAAVLRRHRRRPGRR